MCLLILQCLTQALLGDWYSGGIVESAVLSHESIRRMKEVHAEAEAVHVASRGREGGIHVRKEDKKQ